MLKVECVICENEINNPGALLISSPYKNRLHAKHHLCLRCEKILQSFIMGLKIKLAMTQSTRRNKL